MKWCLMQYPLIENTRRLQSYTCECTMKIPQICNDTAAVYALICTVKNNIAMNLGPDVYASNVKWLNACNIHTVGSVVMIIHNVHVPI